jgi:hypothetical protein
MPNRLDPRDVLVYVRSEDVIQRVTPPDAQNEVVSALKGQGFYTFGPTGWAGPVAISDTAFNAGNFANKPITSRELPEDEEEAVRLVLKIALAKGKNVHLVDVGKESALRRLIEERLHHLRHYPVLVRPDGRRLEGLQNVTPGQLEAFLSD